MKKISLFLAFLMLLQCIFKIEHLEVNIYEM